jgi:UPF0042 nucleotide-binding protein
LSYTHVPREALKFGSLLLVVGLSGAGKSVTIDTFADLGFLTAQNLPVQLLESFAELLRSSGESVSGASLSLDVDSESKQEQLLLVLSRVSRGTVLPIIIFLDATTETIIRRYALTRRPHPSFDPELDNTLEDAIERERSRLFALREMAHILIDTSEMNVHDLRAVIRSYAASPSKGTSQVLRVNFLSFGFKHGVPIDCDILIDTRFLPNPFFVDALREKTGLDVEVQSHVFASGVAHSFVERYLSLLEFLLPQFAASGKSYLNIGVGCTGGRHRSVAVSTKLANDLAQHDLPVQILVGAKHRDIAKPQ